MDWLEKHLKHLKPVIYSTIALVLVVILGTGSFYTVDQSETGVLTRNGVIVKTVTPGLWWKMPFIDSVTLYTTSIQKVYIQDDIARASDNQRNHSNIDVQFYLTPDSAPVVYTKYRDYKDNISLLAENEYKDVIGQYDSAAIPSSRDEIQNKIFERTSKEAMRLYHIQVTRVQLMDIWYDQIYDEAIRKMTVAKANKSQAEIDKQRAIIDAEKLRIEADAQAVSVKAKADGDAYATTVTAKANAEKTRLEGQATADSIRAQTEALKTSPEFVNYTVAKSWDGKLPVNIGVGASSASIPMLNLSGIH